MMNQTEKLLPRVHSVIPESDFNLLITFTNGEIKRYDTKPLLDYPVYQSLRKNFHLVKTEYGTAVWPGGIDISPETLYLKSDPI